MHQSQQVEPLPPPRWGPGGSDAAACCCRRCDLYARQKKGWRRRGGFVLNITSKETRLPLFPRRRWRLCSGQSFYLGLLLPCAARRRCSAPGLKDPGPPTRTRRFLYRHQTGGGVEQRALDQLIKVM